LGSLCKFDLTDKVHKNGRARVGDEMSAPGRARGRGW